MEDTAADQKRPAEEKGKSKPPRRYPVLDFNQPWLRWRVAFFLLAGVVEAVLLGLGAFKLLEFTETPEFCGTLCHNVMRPEYVAFQNSPHARVLCAECHIGSGASYLVKSKVQGAPLIFATLTNIYERPIPTPVENLRPAWETCEQCHWPQRFSEDRLRVYSRYDTEETNTNTQFTMAFKVGGGEPGRAKGIHWHVASNLWYLPLDEKRQEIAWVAVEREDGSVTRYFDPDRLDTSGRGTSLAGRPRR